MNLIRKEKDGGYLSFLISISLRAQDQLKSQWKMKAWDRKQKCGTPFS